LLVPGAFYVEVVMIFVPLWNYVALSCSKLVKSKPKIKINGSVNA